jgi:hypothetical protein
MDTDQLSTAGAQTQAGKLGRSQALARRALADRDGRETKNPMYKCKADIKISATGTT